MDSTRDFNKSVVERILRDPKFALELLDEVAIHLSNGELDTAKRMLRQLVKGTFNFDPTGDLAALLSEKSNASLEQLTTVHASLKKHRTSIDLF